jgi:hypothetical protein
VTKGQTGNGRSNEEKIHGNIQINFKLRMKMKMRHGNQECLDENKIDRDERSKMGAPEARAETGRLLQSYGKYW